MRNYRLVSFFPLANLILAIIFSLGWSEKVLASRPAEGEQAVSSDFDQTDEEFERTLASAAKEVDAEADALAEPSDDSDESGDSEMVDLKTHLQDVVTAMMPKREKTCRVIASKRKASFYSHRFNGKKTASGERFSNRNWSAAHATLPFGSVLRVTNSKTGATVEVTVIDRGPFKCKGRGKARKCKAHPSREVDLSQRAFTALFANLDSGEGEVDASVCE
ncbi:MAG: septal ring lytic transglycosylase RlpA family protein [Bdellovibrionota bacterium]